MTLENRGKRPALNRRRSETTRLPFLAVALIHVLLRSAGGVIGPESTAEFCMDSLQPEPAQMFRISVGRGPVDEDEKASIRSSGLGCWVDDPSGLGTCGCAVGVLA